VQALTSIFAANAKLKINPTQLIIVLITVQTQFEAKSVVAINIDAMYRESVPNNKLIYCKTVFFVHFITSVLIGNRRQN